MIQTLSPNTQAILLLTAPLIAGRGTVSPDFLSPGEYKRLARHLREIQRQPADLVSPDATKVLRACHPVIDENRLQKLLGRGFLLSQVVERWQTRAIWVVSRADAEYPRRLKDRLREDAPSVLYGCGNMDLLESGGLAVVGSRHVDGFLIDYTTAVGRLAARAGRTVVSGGAKGIDQAAMRGALEAGGKVCGVLADSLEKIALNREHRNMLLNGQLVLVSPYDPSAGFSVGNAMQRNKLIYALADASLVVNSDLKKGGTWAGAVEQLDKFKFVPVYLRSPDKSCPAFEALRKKGALPWPNPQDADSFEEIFSATASLHEKNLVTTQLTLFVNPRPSTQNREISDIKTMALNRSEHCFPENPMDNTMRQDSEIQEGTPKADSLPPANETSHELDQAPHEMLFDAVRQAIQKVLIKPMKEAEIAEKLDVSNSQARIWLKRLAEDGMVKKMTRPVQYVLRKPNPFS